MFCTQCGSQVADDDKFCTACGAVLDANDKSEEALANKVDHVTLYETDAVNVADKKTEAANSGSSKKIFIIVLVILILAAAGIVYFIFSSADKDTAQDNNNINNNNNNNINSNITETSYVADNEIHIEDNAAIMEALQDKQGEIVELYNSRDVALTVDAYWFYFDKYNSAVFDGWNAEECTKNNLNYRFSGVSLNDIAYELIDINNDGIEELIVSILDNEHKEFILDLYTVYRNIELVQLFSANEWEQYRLLTDGTIYREFSNDDLERCCSFYRLDTQGITLKLQECFIYDETLSSGESWFYCGGAGSDLVKAADAGFSKPLDYISEKQKYYKMNLLPYREMGHNTYYEYILPGSDSRYIDKSELYGFTAEQCRLARNELYARHGRKFISADLQEYFNAQPWYTPTVEPDAFTDSMFNEYEKANRDLIVNYEKKQGFN